MHHVDQFGNTKSHHFLDPLLDPQRLGDSRNPVPPSVLMFIACDVVSAPLPSRVPAARDVASAPLPSCMLTACNVASTPLPPRVFIAHDAVSAPLPSLRPRHAMRCLPSHEHDSHWLGGFPLLCLSFCPYPPSSEAIPLHPSGLIICLHSWEENMASSVSLHTHLKHISVPGNGCVFTA